jgi:SgrR family transcriptional regulator
MTHSPLNRHYARLYQSQSGQATATTLDTLAAVLGCTRRHMRNLLQQMQGRGWIDWQARAGRGGRSRLTFLKPPEELQRDLASSLLEQGRIAQAIEQLGGDRRELSTLLLSRLGQRWLDDRQVLTVPYYRPLLNLYPGTPLRRSERHLVGQVFNGLTCINEEKGEVEPGLAHHWYQISPLEWHFHLRPAVRWHDGRRLDMNDVLTSLERLRALPLYRHIRAVRAQSERCVSIELSEPDIWLLWLLADSPAMILPADHAARPGFAALPVGTGPYRVCANDELHLRLQAFDEYFGYRALLDEVDIWIVPELATERDASGSDPCHLQVQINPGAHQGEYSDMEPEQGCYFLLCDTRSPWLHDDARRQWLARVLSPLDLSGRLPPEVRQFWTPAASLLPQWFHGQMGSSAGSAPTQMSLRLAYYDRQPDYEHVALAMREWLAGHGVELECRAIDYEQWERGEGGFDLWLGSINFAGEADFAVAAWLLGTPLLRASLGGSGQLPLADWHAAWRGGSMDARQITAEVVQRHWLLPLFHSWFRLQGTRRMRGVRLNDLGWFDFKSAWLVP